MISSLFTTSDVSIVRKNIYNASHPILPEVPKSMQEVREDVIIDEYCY